jgi:riboflavin kinase/FMN adenylyltransferase
VLFNVDVEVMEPLRIGATTVSSSKIRELIKDGEVEEASKLLGRNYPVMGKVVQERRGTNLGFPTANLEISKNCILKGESMLLKWYGINSSSTDSPVSG